MDDPLAWTADDQECALKAIAPWYELDFGPLSDDIDMLLELLDPGLRVLELGAGSGRIAVPLAEHGIHVTAVDSSPAMLEIGESAMQDADVAVVRGDMRCLRLSEQFDVVVLGLSTVQHLLRRQDQLSTLQAARRHMGAGGRIVIDWTAPRADDVEPSAPALQLQWLRTASNGDRVSKFAMQELALERRCGADIDRASPIAWITYQYDALKTSGQVHRSQARFPLRVNLNAGEMAGLLAESGWRPLDWYGSWDFAAVGDGDRLIVIAEAAP